jgi:hypothetical protein
MSRTEMNDFEFMQYHKRFRARVERTLERAFQLFVLLFCILATMLVLNSAPNGVRIQDTTCRDAESLRMRDDCRVN